MSKVTIGYDVEFFIADERGVIVSAIDKIPGTKEVKFVLQTGAGLHHDNVSLEIAFQPFDSFEEMEDHITKTLAEVETLILPNKLVVIPSHVFPSEELQDRRAFEFGCDPDFNAWSGRINPRPRSTDPNLRSNGGHVHVGITDLVEDYQNHFLFIKNLDLFLGEWSLDHDKDMKRRELYGKAGSFRPKDYGLEYRVLSNFWIMDPALRREVWKRTIQVAKLYESGELFEVPTSTQEKIDTGVYVDAD